MRFPGIHKLSGAGADENVEVAGKADVQRICLWLKNLSAVTGEC